eukprot:730114_1
MLLFHTETSTTYSTRPHQSSQGKSCWRTSFFQERHSKMIRVIRQNMYKLNQIYTNNSHVDAVKVKNANICMICFDKDLFGDQLHYTQCGHNYCKTCLSTHYKTKILDGDVLNLTCIDPSCDRKIGEIEILQFIHDGETKRKFDRFRKNALLRMNKNVIFCRKPNCDGYAYNKHNLCGTLECGLCDTRMCRRCYQPFHGYVLGCNQSVDIEYYKWALFKDIQQCPNCMVKIEKNGGCNHMTCRRCKYQFCWICRGHYTYGHYNWSMKNLFGCPGGQYTWRFIRFPSWTPFWMNRIIMVLLLIPILCIAAVVAFMCWCFRAVRDIGKVTQKIIVLCLLMVFIGSISTALYWSGFIGLEFWF